MEPPHSYLREQSASVVHHADYLNGCNDRALCGVAVENSTALTQMNTADAACPDCDAKLVVYHLQWWRARAEEATAELEVLRVKYRELAPGADSEAPQEQAPEVEQDQVGSSDESAQKEATTFLDSARRELTKLYGQFDGAIPFYRLKNAMQDFSDTLTDNERLVLAQEVGSDSSLIRWATIEVESRGLSVSNNRVQENSDMMWQEWLEESQQQQAPTKTKRRFGRSR